MKRGHASSLLALVFAASCALPALRVDPELDEDDAGSSGDAGSSSGGATGGGGSPTGGRGGGTTGGSDNGGSGGTSTGGTSAGGATGGAATGGSATGGATTGGAAGTCGAGLTRCKGACTNTDTDEAHCGACDGACDFGQVCTNGDCECQSLVGLSSYLLIDDLEDEDNAVGNERAPQLRVGYWFVFNDATEDCTQYPPPDPDVAFVPNCGNADCSMLLPTPNGSRAAAHMAGGGCSLWGAGMGFDFNSCANGPSAYDASAYRGVRFYYRSTTAFRVVVGIMANIPVENGGTCADAPIDCYNHHGADLPASTAGTTVTLPFSSLTQNFGTLRPFDASDLSGLQFQVNETAQPYDLWIDDVSFVL
jgi:hypothetical protein